MPKNGEVKIALVLIPDDANECWAWNGNINKRTGYGKKTHCGKHMLAHRWVFETLLGPIPEGLVINHLCGNRRCVNPTHLELTDQAGNCRHGKGAKLRPDEVAAIKTAKNEKKWGTGTALAKKYNVSASLIFDIWYGRAWAEPAAELEQPACN